MIVAILISNNNGTGNIDKWPYATDGNSTDVGQLSLGQIGEVGSSASGSYGFWHGGSPAQNGITKTSWASDGNSVDTGADLESARLQCGGQSSSTYGYASGGGSPYVNIIQKYSFDISSGTTTDVGDLTQVTYNQSCFSSSDYRRRRRYAVKFKLEDIG